MSLARAIVSGTVVSDPEKRFTSNNNAVTNFTIQVNPTAGSKDTPYLVNVTCWRGLADVVTEQLRKGSQAVVEGRLQIHQFEGPGGAQKRTYEIDASNVFLGDLHPLAPASEGQSSGNSKPSSSQALDTQSYSAPTQQQQKTPVGVGPAMPAVEEHFSQDDLLTENDIPF
jgi:single-strand DNA-binding protein